MGGVIQIGGGDTTGASRLLVAGTSTPFQLLAGVTITLVPTSGSTARVEYSASADVNVQNGTAVWTAWPKGTVSATTSDAIVQDTYARIVVVAGQASWTVDRTLPPFAYGGSPWASNQITNPPAVTATTDAITGRNILSIQGSSINIEAPQTCVLLGDSNIGYGWASALWKNCVNGAGLGATAYSSAIAVDARNWLSIGDSTTAAFNGTKQIITKQAGASTVNISNISAHSDGLVKITTATAHSLSADQVVIFASITGTGVISTDVNGRAHFVKEVLDANNYTIYGIPFSGTYTSGGTSQKAYAAIFACVTPYAKIVAVESFASVWTHYMLNRMTQRSWWPWMQAYLNWPFQVVNFAAVNGETATQMINRVETDVFAYNPGWCFIFGGGNDMSALGLTPQQAATAMQTLIKTVRARNINVVASGASLMTSASSTYSAGANNLKAHRFNILMRDWCQQNGVIWVSMGPHQIDPTSVTGDAQATLCASDGDHLNATSAQDFGKKVAATISGMVGGNSIVCPISAADCIANDASSSQYFRNPLFLTATGGNVSTGGSGAAPANVTVERGTGSPTFAVSVVARTVATDGDAFGNNIVVVMTPATSGNSIAIRMACTVGDFVAGTDFIEGSVMATIDSTSAGGNSRAAQLYVTTNNFGAYASTFDGDSDSPSRNLADITNLPIKTSVLAIPSGGLTSVELLFYIGASAAWTTGTITVKLGRPSLRKVSALSL